MDWAANKTKLARATTDVENKHRINPAVEVTEEAIKARYIEIGGLVFNEEQIEEVVEKKTRKAKK